MSGIILLIMCVAIVAALGAWLAVVALAQRHPGTRRPAIERRRGRVQGGSHTGGGRSLGPHRDEEAVPGEDPEGSSVPGMDSETGSVPEQRRPARESGSPLDL